MCRKHSKLRARNAIGSPTSHAEQKIPKAPQMRNRRSGRIDNPGRGWMGDHRYKSDRGGLKSGESRCTQGEIPTRKKPASIWIASNGRMGISTMVAYNRFASSVLGLSVVQIAEKYRKSHKNRRYRVHSLGFAGGRAFGKVHPLVQITERSKLRWEV